MIIPNLIDGVPDPVRDRDDNGVRDLMDMMTMDVAYYFTLIMMMMIMIMLLIMVMIIMMIILVDDDDDDVPW